MDFSMETLAYVSGLIYRKFHPIWFILYMYAEYDKILKRSVKYHIRQPHPLLDDLNNIVLVPEKNLYKSDRFLKLIWGDVAENRTRLVRVIPSVDCKPHEVHLGALLLYNLNIPVPKHEIVVELHDCKNGNSIKYAEEVDVSLIRYPGEISHATVDLLLQNYFMFPKLVYKNDIIQVDLRRYGERFFYTNFKINQVTSVSFKCNRVVYGGKEQTGGFFCFYGVTTLKQSADCQSFLPDSPNNCPYGLCDEFYKIHKAVVPFLRKKVNLNPVFLLQGEAGCGKETLVRCLAKVLGMHFYYVSNSELAASVYAQNETKLRNVFFNAQMSAPCIVFINNFENFGKNNDGQFDERLIGNFATELNLLFNKTNPFPILLFCASNSKTVASNLQRLFLEVIKITAPNDWNRKNMLQWILEQDKIAYSCDLDKVANKTHGFFFNDLRALVYYARRDKEQILTEIDFSNAVDFMQVAYNSSLGAPKVPKVQWDDVGGLTEVKNEIIRTINLPLKHPDLLKASGLHRTGILLFGPPGTGKTLLAKAVATECNLCFLSVKGPELLNMYVGQSEENVREVFEKARQASPCIIFFDELDSLAPNRGLSGDSGGVMDRVVSQLLAEMDGLNENESSTVFIIGATNRPDLIDPALLRPGRFDKLLYVGPCVDFQSKVAVFKALTRKFKLADDVNIDELVKSCPDNVTGADFYGICSTAWASAVGKLIKKLEEEECTIITDTTSEEVRVCSVDFKAAISNVKPSITKDDLLYFEQLQKELASNL